MKTIVLMNIYEWPEKRKEDAKKADARLVLASCEGSQYRQYISIGMEGGAAMIVLGEQVTKATKNACNTVRGCLSVQSTLDTFDAAPMSYEQQQKTVKRAGPQVLITSTASSGFVAVTLPERADSVIVRADEILAAVDNVTRT